MNNHCGLSGLMKNVFTFANILNQAGTEAAKKWNQQSISNAFNWAAYCEKVYDEVKGKPYEPDICRKLRGLTVHLTPPSCLVLDLQDLKSATTLLLSVCSYHISGNFGVGKFWRIWSISGIGNVGAFKIDGLFKTPAKIIMVKFMDVSMFNDRRNENKLTRN
ncbi:hypothetical protein FSP39_025150 [Pinctada imbricata]|uniref:Uncharacterized protein n=1 Tax=Pinctada imbricata TaxID=66713 RepID=A0AA89C064_PINIB|nr:hypothetical protein FSP39_025150 [Pinctada imbricata]